MIYVSTSFFSFLRYFFIGWGILNFLNIIVYNLVELITIKTQYHNVYKITNPLYLLVLPLTHVLFQTFEMYNMNKIYKPSFIHTPFSHLLTICCFIMMWINFGMCIYLLFPQANYRHNHSSIVYINVISPYNNQFVFDMDIYFKFTFLHCFIYLCLFYLFELYILFNKTDPDNENILMKLSESNLTENETKIVMGIPVPKNDKKISICTTFQVTCYWLLYFGELIVMLFSGIQQIPIWVQFHSSNVSGLIICLFGILYFYVYYGNNDTDERKLSQWIIVLYTIGFIYYFSVGVAYLTIESQEIQNMGLNYLDLYSYLYMFPIEFPYHSFIFQNKYQLTTINNQTLDHYYVMNFCSMASITQSINIITFIFLSVISLSHIFLGLSSLFISNQNIFIEQQQQSLLTKKE